jgi:type II secretory pathway pseudopilin PulG
MRGDTIVEVLIAIAVAAFAIGTSYAIASRSIARAISARERNEATNLIQSQISALKFRQIKDPDGFNEAFGVPSAFIGTGTARHFCLNSQSQGPGDTANQWAPYVNNVDDVSAGTLTTGASAYNTNCAPSPGGDNYYIDISAMVTAASQSVPGNRSVFRVSVRWSEASTGLTQQALVYYRF